MMQMNRRAGTNIHITIIRHFLYCGFLTAVFVVLILLLSEKCATHITIFI